MHSTTALAAAAPALADREFWLERRDELRAAAVATADAVGMSVADTGEAHAELPAPVARRLAEVTGGEPLLRWTVVAAAAALTARRFGIAGQMLLLAGDLPVIAPLAPLWTFRELLGAVRAGIGRARAHPDLPKAIAEVLAAHPLVAVHESGPRPAAAVTISLRDNGVEVSGRLSAARARHLADSIAEVIARGLTAPDTRVARIGVMSPERTAVVIDGFNDTPGLPPAAPYREQVIAHARARPDAIALRDKDTEIDYARLCRSAAGVAGWLHAAGARTDDVVAVVGSRSAWFVTAGVGILFAGAAYLPVDAATPPERLKRVLEGACAVIADDGQQLPDNLTQPVLRLGEIEGLPVTDPSIIDLPHGRALAYLIFTSGSTGVPKGAALEHRSFLNMMAIRVQNCDLRSGVELAQTVPLTSDVSVWQMFAGLTAGACVHVVDDDTVRSPEALTALTAARGFEYLEVVPAQLELLIDHLLDDPGRAAAVRAVLRGIICNGEVLGTDLARRWHELMPGITLFNAYGPAECTDDNTQGTVLETDGATATVGRPLSNIRVYVLDRDCQPVPPGVLGQIHIGGLSVGRGYFRAPGLTATSFVPDPFSPTPGGRMYRTGDLGRWRPDGELECLGRADGQVKVRGRRVELGEIEHVVESGPTVARAVVELVGGDGVARLVAFVTPMPGATPSAQTVLEHARQHLSDYMVPSEVLVRDRLPLSSNGKVDRKALRELARRHLADTAARGDQVAPRTEVERLLADLWARHLKLPSVGVHDDFFALGGDSIINIRILQAAGREGVALRPKYIYDHRTIAELAAVARARDAVAQAVADGESAPLTPIQRWFFHQDFSEPHHWNQSYCLRATRPLDPGVLAKALGALSRTHEQLRVRFTGDEELRQVVTPATGVVLWQARPTSTPDRFELVVDGTVVATGTVSDLADRLHASLSLDTGRLLGALLIDDDPDGPRLLLTIHHLAVDRVSWLVLLEDLASYYLAIAGGDEPSPPPRTAGFVHWARALAAQPDPHHAQLPQQDEVLVPVHDEVPNLVADRQTAVVDWDHDATTRLTRVATATSDEGLHAALVAALARAAAVTWGEGTLPIELEGHGRLESDRLPDISRTVGWFTVLSTLPLPARRDGPPAAAVAAAGDLLASVRHEAMAERTASPQIAFNFMGRVDSSSDDPDELFTITDDIGWKCSPKGHRPLEWEINAGVVDGRLTVHIEHVPARHPDGTVEGFLDAFRAFLAEFAAQTPSGELVDDLVPLTPTQLVFFARELPSPDRYNHAVLLALREPVSTQQVEHAVAALVERHPALRTRIVWTPRGPRQGAADAANAIPVTEVDLRGAGADLAGAVERAADELHGGINLRTGPIGRIGLIRTPDGTADELLVVLHHVIMDPLSWDILVPELSALLDGQQLDPPGPGYHDWARRLAEYARRADAGAEAARWLGQDWTDCVSWPDNKLPGLEEHTGTVFSEFDVDETDELLRSARLARITPFELVLVDLARAAELWLGDRPGGHILIELGGHGREDLFADLDVSTTIGWFTTSYPFRLPLPRGRDQADHTAEVVDAIRAVPRRGFDFELGKYLHPDPDVRAALDAIPSPQLRFDFDGELRFANAATDGATPMLSAGRTAGTGRWKSPDTRREHLLDAVAYVHDGRLNVRWQFSTDVLDPADVAELVDLFAQSLRSHGRK